MQIEDRSLRFVRRHGRLLRFSVAVLRSRVWTNWRLAPVYSWLFRRSIPGGSADDETDPMSPDGQWRYECVERHWPDIHRTSTGEALLGPDGRYAFGAKRRGRRSRLGAGFKNNAAEVVAKELNVSVYQVAIAWLLHRSPVMLPIPGTSSVRHLEENVAARKLKLTDEQLKALDAAA